MMEKGIDDFDSRRKLTIQPFPPRPRSIASYLCFRRVQDLAVAAHEASLVKMAGLGSRIDIRLAMIRVGFFHSDHALISSNIALAQSLVDEGGDWDRRNRLKVYQGLHFLAIRNFKAGGELLLETLSTFTATELIDYEDFAVLCILAGVMTLERKDLKKKVCVTTLPSLLFASQNLIDRFGIRNADSRQLNVTDIRS